MGILDVTIAIVTGSGHGIGRGEALELVAPARKVVVNDFGGSPSGESGTVRAGVDNPAGEANQDPAAVAAVAAAVAAVAAKVEAQIFHSRHPGLRMGG